ncbi:MAG: DUF4166 domain-containing protein [Alphaproteobacteria bacterium]|nr:DUF4166 domain-containing protein [Alphaproteobacteria bacterium]
MIEKEPIFKSIFGRSWDDLPPVVRKHYANRPYTHDHVTAEGVLDTFCAGPIRWMSPLFWMMRGIPPHTEKDVKVTVFFESDKDTKYFHFNRIFSFKGRKSYNFTSRMVQIKYNEVVEIMRYGFGWRMGYFWEDGKVKLKHKGYVFHLYGIFIPLPLSLLIGKGYAEETPIDDNTFDMFMQIVHPLWGKVYEYKGRFEVKYET